MSRSVRIQFEGALYHVTARGNERQAIVRDYQGGQRFLACLGSFRETRKLTPGTGFSPGGTTDCSPG